LGDAILDAVVREVASKDELTAWYADVRERFPNMEAPSQTYARYLERWGSPAEVGIAWASAFHKDELDARNALGWGRALKRMGRTEEAYVRFRDASRLDPDDPTLYGWLSTCHFARDDLAGAELWARIACDVQPQNRSARALLADALEAQDDPAAAEPPLREAWELGHLPEDGIRVARATYRNADLGGARTLAVEVARRAGGSEAWAEAIHLTVALGEANEAWELARTVARAPRPQGWHFSALDGTVTLAPDLGTATERVAALVELVGRDVPALCDLAIELAWRGHPTLARVGIERLQVVAPDDPNTPWALVRAALRGERLAEERAAVDDAVDRLVATMAPGFVPVRAVACALAAESAPTRALELATHPSFVDDPKSWLVQSVALRALGETARAEALEKRLASLDGSSLALVADFYRFYRFWDLALGALRHADAQTIDADKDLSLEQAALDLRVAPSPEAFDRARAAWKKFDWIPGAWVCRAGGLSARRDALVEDGSSVAQGFAKSSGRAGDVWVYRAFAAAARFAGDGGASRAEIVLRMPEHPWVRCALVIAGEGFGAAHAVDDRAALERVCPVAASALVSRWGRP
jgi:Flp pilus assembly protein TadD